MSCPARRYSWPQFVEGNTAAVKHGAGSARWGDDVGPIAARLAAELVEVAPWTAEPVFAAEVAAWAHAEGEARLLRAYVSEHGPLTDDGEPRGVLDALHRVETRAAKRRSDLGLSPSAWARLSRDLAAAGPEGAESVAELRAVGRRIVEARST